MVSEVTTTSAAAAGDNPSDPVRTRQLSAPRGSSHTLRARLVSHAWVYAIFLPVFAFLMIFQYWPILLSVVVAFKDFRIGSGLFRSPWVGLENFAEIFSDPGLIQVFKNTVKISLLRLGCGFLPPIILAIMLHDLRLMIFKKISQTVIYIPHFFSWVIVFGIYFAIFATGTGLINNVISSLGGERIEFLLSSSWFIPILIAAGIWKEIGWSTIIYMAALSTVDPQLFEAAAVDGAGPLRRVWHVTLPSILPVVTFTLTLSLGFILYAGGEQVLAFYNTAVYDVADVIDTWVYREGLGRLQFSIGTAMGLLQSMVGLILVLGANAAARRFTGRGIW